MSCIFFYQFNFMPCIFERDSTSSIKQLNPANIDDTHTFLRIYIDIFIVHIHISSTFRQTLLA